jgi:hypothetical protein
MEDRRRDMVRAIGLRARVGSEGGGGLLGIGERCDLMES